MEGARGAHTYLTIDVTPGDVQRLLAGDIDTFRITHRYLRADGSAVHAQLSTRLVRDRVGQPLYFSTQTVDITARWTARLELETRELMLAGVMVNSQSLI